MVQSAVCYSTIYLTRTLQIKKIKHLRMTFALMWKRSHELYLLHAACRGGTLEGMVVSPILADEQTVVILIGGLVVDNIKGQNMKASLCNPEAASFLESLDQLIEAGCCHEKSQSINHTNVSNMINILSLKAKENAKYCGASFSISDIINT